MGLIPESHKEIVRKKLAAMKEEEVSIVYFTQEIECAYCRETHEMLKEVSELSDKLRLQVFDFQTEKAEAVKYKVDKISGIVIRNQKDYGIRFYGVPAATNSRPFWMTSSWFPRAIQDFPTGRGKS